MKAETKAKYLNTIYTILAISGMILFIVTVIHPNWFSLVSCGILAITALIAFFMAQAEIRKVELMNREIEIDEKYNKELNENQEKIEL